MRCPMIMGTRENMPRAAAAEKEEEEEETWGAADVLFIYGSNRGSLTMALIPRPKAIVASKVDDNKMTYNLLVS